MGSLPQAPVGAANAAYPHNGLPGGQSIRPWRRLWEGSCGRQDRDAGLLAMGLF